MVNITHKSSTLRKAIAIGELKVSTQETIDAIVNRKVPKGDVFEFSRAAGLLACKKTYEVIPDCHPLPIEYTSITHEIVGLSIIIKVEVHTIYKTGVEVEAMHGVSITALTMYDMLKPIDNGISAGQHIDISGDVIVSKLKLHKLDVIYREAIADEFDTIQSKTKELIQKGYQLILFTGGTGLSPRDVTPDAIRPLLDREVPGIMEVARDYGQQRTPYAMLSRGVAGFIGNSLIITMPGSPRGAEETMDALFPYILHVFRVKEGVRHN
jgi:cyclic pyranopterin phosphate synthase